MSKVRKGGERRPVRGEDVNSLALSSASSNTPSPENQPAVERLALRLDEVAKALGVSRRTIERERSAGRFPQADLYIGKCPLWRPATLNAWIEGGGGR